MISMRSDNSTGTTAGTAHHIWVGARVPRVKIVWHARWNGSRIYAPFRLFRDIVLSTIHDFLHHAHVMLRCWAHLRSKLGRLLVDIGAGIGRSHEELGGEVIELSNTAGLRINYYS